MVYAWGERGFAGRIAYRFSFVITFISMGISFVALYYVSRLVPKELLPHGDYFTVTLIGIGLYSFISAISNAPRHFIMNEMGGGTLETLLTLSPSLQMHIAAITISQALRTLARSSFIIIIPWFLGWDIRLGSFHLLIPIFVLGGAAAFGIGLIQSAIDIRVRTVGRVVSVFSGASALLSGVYFPVALLPAPLRLVGNLLPAKHAIDGARVILFTSETPWSIYLVLAGLAIILLLAGVVMMRAALHVMRRDGTFLTY